MGQGGEDKVECQLIKALFNAVDMMRAEERLPRDYGAGGPLYHAQVSLLGAIARNPGLSAGELAHLMGITKGALAQIAKKLWDKGLIEPYHPQGNKKVKYYRLTQAGETARQGYEAYHLEAAEGMRGYLCALPLEEKRVMQDFFVKLEEFASICAYDCGAPEGMCMDKLSTPNTKEAG